MPLENLVEYIDDTGTTFEDIEVAADIFALRNRGIYPGFENLGKTAVLASAEKGEGVAQHVVYGQAITSGVEVFKSTRVVGGEERHYVVLAVAGHVCDGIAGVYLGEEYFATAIPSSVGTYSGVYLATYNGLQTKADGVLVHDIAEWDSSFIGRDICYLVVRAPVSVLERLPSIKVVVRGVVLFDPRTGNSSWSDNAALVIYDYITRDGGYGGIESVIDLQSFSDAADICDELDTVNFNKDGTPGSFSARKFNINGVIKADSSRGEVLAEFQKHIGGFIFFRAGEWFIRMGVLDSQLAVTDIGEEDVVDSLSLVEVPPVRGYVNRLSGSFVDPSADYVPVSYGQLDSSDKSNVGGVVLGKKLDFLYANNRVQALRLATLYFNIYQKFIRVSLKVDWRLADIVEGDIVRLRFSEAHKDKHFLVEKSSLDRGGGNVGLHLREWGNDIYDFVDEDVVDTIITDSGREGRWLVVELPINLSVSQSISYSNKSAGNRVNVLLSWKAGGTFTEAFDIAINGKVVVTDIPLVVTEHLFEDVVYNVGEEETVFSVRGKNFYGARGSWADVSLVVGGVEGPPDILRGVSLGYDGIYGIFNWLKVESIQVLNAGSIHVRYSESDVVDVEEAWDEGSLSLVSVVSGDDTSLRLVFDKGFYYFRVFDSLDNFSDIVKFYNSQGSVPLGVFLDEHPSFLGLPNDFTLLDGCLLSSTNSNFFSVANIYDVANIFDGNGGAIESIYYFNSRLSFDIAAERLMRSFVGYTIQGEVGIADFDLRVQFRSRAEKSQVFGDWADMQNDYTRYYFIEMEFRLVFTPLVSVFFRVCVNFLRLFYEGQSGVAVLAESSLFEGFVDGMQVVNGFLESVGEGDNMYDIVNMYLVENMYRLSSGSKSGSYYFGLALNLGEEGARDIRSLLAFTVSGDDSSDSSAFSVEVQYRVSSTEAGSFGGWVGLSDIFVALVFWRIQFRLVFGVGEGKQVNLSVSNLQIEYK